MAGAFVLIGSEPGERAIFQVRKRETGGMEKP